MPTPHSEQIISTLRPVDLARLDAIADERDVSRAALIREYVLEGMFQYGAAKADDALKLDEDGFPVG